MKENKRDREIVPKELTESGDKLNSANNVCG